MIVDLRSDTVTKPTAGMRRAIAEAEVGDDVYGEDPTVNRLEEKAAELLGKEAAVFVPSGTMANQIAIRCQTRPGNEIILDSGAHPFHFEAGAIAALSSVQVRLTHNPRGAIPVESLRELVRPVGDHFPRTALVCAENTHNTAGGCIYPLEDLRKLCEEAHKLGINVHMDGARLFNAVVETGTGATDYAASCDTVSFCLSKGLGAPAGSLVTGTRDFAAEARRCRKVLGGGMRQAGILAAAGLYALENHVERLKDDHQRARKLADALMDSGKYECINQPVETNMVVFRPKGDRSLQEIVSKAKEKGVLLGIILAKQIRAVTHLDVGDNEIERAVEVLTRS